MQLWLIPTLPLAGFLINGIFGRRFPKSLVNTVAVGSVLLSFLWVLKTIFAMGDLNTPHLEHYFTWIQSGALDIGCDFLVDRLTIVMLLVVTGIGSLIPIYSIGYMSHAGGYYRFFAYLTLFMFFMLVLVLGASFLLLFVGWEGVGLCSYLLIGFYFDKKFATDAGNKAFIVNRIGDFGFSLAMFYIFKNFGSLDFDKVFHQAASAPEWVLTTIGLLLMVGACGKSAQIPLYIWLPDAMAGPTPVSALIHAATMVTAGVYLIARSSFLFSLSPVASLTVAVVGAVTAIFAATIGLKQWDIKKVLAYSTISQLGYMFVGVGVGAYVSGMFHLITHSFFKALLFLGSGSVIHAMHAAYHRTHSQEDAQDMRNMGGLRRYLPVTCVLMWIATLAISGIPPLSGFTSKDEILGSVFARAQGSTLASATWLGIPGSTLLYIIYAIGLAAAFLTAVYMTRMMLYTFHGPARTGTEEEKALHEAPWIMTGPLVVLGALTVFGGWLNLPEVITGIIPLGPRELLAHWLDPVVGDATTRITGGATHVPALTEQALIGAAVVIAVAGIVFAMTRLKPDRLPRKRDAVPEHGFEGVVAHKYYVDEGIERTIVEPTYAVSRSFLWRVIDNGLIDGFFVNGSAALARGFGWVGSRLQTGNVGVYAWVLVVGVLVMLGAFTLR